MTIKRLEQYASKRKEVAYYRRRVADLRDRAATQRISDTVKASSRSFPYTEHTVTMRGYSDKCAGHLANAIRRLAQREAFLAKELDEIEKWLDTVQDSKTRLLIELYYVEGKTWRSSAQQVYGRPYESTARSRVERYFKNNFVMRDLRDSADV